MFSNLFPWVKYFVNYIFLVEPPERDPPRIRPDDTRSNPSPRCHANGVSGCLVWRVPLVGYAHQHVSLLLVLSCLPLVASIPEPPLAFLGETATVVCLSGLLQTLEVIVRLYSCLGPKILMGIKARDLSHLQIVCLPLV